MLRITVPINDEQWDEMNQVFIEPKEQTLELEHSLVSLKKWEARWHKVFISKKPKTLEETIDYIKCMTLTPNVDPEVYNHLTNENIKEINEYIDDSMTAISFPKDNKGQNSREPITAEIIYYWMISLGIPFECREWHVNELISLIRVCEIKNKPPKNMSKGEIMRRNSAMNAARRKQLNTKG